MKGDGVWEGEWAMGGGSSYPFTAGHAARRDSFKNDNELQLTAELQKSPVDGFSAGLVDDDNILEWQIVIMG